MGSRSSPVIPPDKFTAGRSIEFRLRDSRHPGRRDDHRSREKQTLLGPPGDPQAHAWSRTPPYFSRRASQPLATCRCRVTGPSLHSDNTAGKKTGGKTGGRRTKNEKTARLCSSDSWKFTYRTESPSLNGDRSRRNPGRLSTTTRHSAAESAVPLTCPISSFPPAPICH